jgi:hypothetical protein
MPKPFGVTPSPNFHGENFSERSGVSTGRQ